ncbi:MAG: hypothetical protein J6R26_04080 [Paludibacteraceae bacterium]|nr:hypothetical protein [Paludibacteraceae bacterium]
MKLKHLFLLALIYALCYTPAMAQSIILTKEFQIMPNIKALDVYRNQFGTYETVGADDPFPYAVIRLGLDGTPKEIEEAKKRLSFQLGRITSVETIFRGARNELLFLVPVRARNIQMSCDGECLPQMMFDSLITLQSNTVLYGRVHFSLEDDTRDPNTLKQYLYTLTVSPADAKVQMRSGFVNQELSMENGQAEQLLTEGTYYYTITSDGYMDAEGSFVVDSLHSDTTINLVHKFGWISITCDSSDLTGLQAKREYAKRDTMISLPVEYERYALGKYSFVIKKPKHHTWRTEVILSPGDHIALTPYLRPKIYQHNNFMMLHGAFAMNPAWSLGVMGGQVYGEVTRVMGIGWYAMGRSNFQKIDAIKGLHIYEGGIVGVIDGIQPAYTGKTRFSEWNLNAGVVLNFLNKQSLNLPKNSMFGLYAGLGYGQYTRYWEIVGGEWIEYAPSSVKGLSFGGGLIGSIKGVTISAGVNTIQAKHMEIEMGLGWTF